MYLSIHLIRRNCSSDEKKNGKRKSTDAFLCKKEQLHMSWIQKTHVFDALDWLQNGNSAHVPVLVNDFKKEMNDNEINHAAFTLK